MIPLESVDHDTFAPLAGHAFLTTTASGPVEIQLSGVKKLGHRRAEATRDPFSLAFRGPQGLRVSQGTYLFACEGLGEIELFITQVADGPQGSEFEAIFT
jgi:hypothetical protein